MELLFVCTGNICRSAIAEAHMRRRASDMALPVDVSSAGFVLDGEAPPEPTRRAAGRHGLDIAEHRSRIVDSPMIEPADLVVVMTNQHAREILGLVPGARRRVFTLRELPRTAAQVEPRGADEDLGGWLARLDEERGAMPHVGVRGTNDIDDPYGRSDRVHRRVATEVIGLVDELVRCTLIEKEPSS